MNICMYKEGEISCVYDTHTNGEPIEICCVSVCAEDQVVVPCVRIPVCSNRETMQSAIAAASTAALSGAKKGISFTYQQDQGLLSATPAKGVQGTT